MPLPFEGSREESFCASSSYCRWPAILGIPSLRDLSLHSLLPLSHGLLPCVSVFPYSNSPLLIRIPVILDLEPTLRQYTSSWLHLQRPCFQIRSHSWGPSRHKFWGGHYSVQYMDVGDGGGSWDGMVMMVIVWCGEVWIVVMMWG